MRKLIVSLLMVLLSCGVALAAADTLRVIDGSTSKITKTSDPQLDTVQFYGLHTRATSTEVSSGEALIGFVPTATGGYLYIISKPTATTAFYRTIGIGVVATNDAIALP